MRKKKLISVTQLGVTIQIDGRTTTNKKTGHVYGYYQIRDYSSGELKKLSFSDLDEAKKAARQLAEAKARGLSHTLDWDALTHAQVHQALELSSIIGLPLDQICQLVMDTTKVLGGDRNLILPAAHYFKENAHHKVLKPCLVKNAIPAFKTAHFPMLGLRRRKTNTSILAQFEQAFGNRNLHEIEPLEIDDWTCSKKYAAKTRNDALKRVLRVSL